MNDVDFKPAGWPIVAPRIVVRDAKGLVNYLHEVFGATGEHQMQRPSEIWIGDSVILIGEPGVRPSLAAFLYVYVSDTDATYQRAHRRGCPLARGADRFAVWRSALHGRGRVGQHLADRDATGALNMQHCVRPARVDEAELLSGLALRSKAHWGYSAEFIEACRDELTISPENLRAAAMRYFVLEREERVIGFYALDAAHADRDRTRRAVRRTRAHRERLRSRADRTRKRTAAALGARRLVIQSDPYAAHFYRAAGGRQTGESESASVPGRYLPTFEITLP